MPYADVNGQHIYFEDTGGSGPPVIFSHGLLMDGSMFAPQVEALRDRYRCITWDERGHGRTATDTLPPFTYYDSADDLVALLEHLEIRQAVLLGMSQGGFLSLRCALTHPDIVRALVLIDTQARADGPARVPKHQNMIENWVTHGFSGEIATTIAHTLLGPDWSGTPAWQAKWKQWKTANLLQCFHTLAQRDDISERIASIVVPSLVIHGESDTGITLDRAEAMAHALPHSELAVIPGAAHAANLTHPEQVNPLIERFLAGLE